MELKIGDKVRYEDKYGDRFRALIIDVWKDDDGEITGYFSVTNSGLYIHFKPDRLEAIYLDEPVLVSKEGTSIT